LTQILQVLGSGREIHRRALAIKEKLLRAESPDITGFQLRTSCVRNSGNLGAEGDPPPALRKAIAKGLQPNSSGHHVNYLEIYEPDVLADQMQPVLRYGASLFE